MDDVKETAVLLTSELAANAVLHAHSTFQVAMEPRPPNLLVEVSDQSSAVPVPASALPQSENGRGLILVEALAGRWGTRLLNGGKAV
jgi:anti-sigma regulatory factor (Ser/Thr protein kinase)